MPERIKIDPLVRIEGHMKADYTITGNLITDAKIAGTMYRGFENFLKNRHPFDAVRITQRICGVCHEVHGVVSCMAIEELYGIELPYNGVLLRELMLALSIISDHMIHFYQLMLPDYADFSSLAPKSGYFESNAKAKYIREKELTETLIDNYKNAIRVRGHIGEALAVIGAKTPFCHALLPGGITTKITPDKLLSLRSIINETYEFLTETMEPDVNLIAEYFPEYFDKGVTYGRYICGESFILKDQPQFVSGIFENGKQRELEPDMITEEISSTYINDKNEPDADKKGAYSWVKTPQYEKKSFETGPIARAVMKKSKLYFEMAKRHKTDPYKSSCMTRILARVSEAIEMAEYMRDMVGTYRLDGSTIHDPDLSAVVTGTGSAFSIASRGVLFHRTIVKEGKIDGYNIIVPSTWNFGPGIAEPGIVEKVLNGTKVGNEDSSIVAGRIVRSFDPCIACAVH